MGNHPLAPSLILSPKSRSLVEKIQIKASHQIISNQIFGDAVESFLSTFKPNIETDIRLPYYHVSKPALFEMFGHHFDFDNDILLKTFQLE